MFGGNLELPKFVKRIKPPLMTQQELTSIHPGLFGHVGRQPNTNYHVELLHYKQKHKDAHLKYIKAEAARLQKERSNEKYDKHVENKYFHRQISDKVKEKLRKFEENVQLRKQKLGKLLCDEELDYYKETVAHYQKATDEKIEIMLRNTEKIRAEREAERKELVYQKRLQQFKIKCEDLRPYIYKNNLIDAKNTNLIQIAEKESRKQAEKQVDQMYYCLAVKQMEERKEKEKQVAIVKHLALKDMIETWEKQKKGKELMKEEELKLKHEDRVEALLLEEQLRNEEFEKILKQRKQREEFGQELLKQIAENEQYLEQRKHEETTLNEAFMYLNRVEMENEKKKSANITQQFKKEIVVYKKYLKELELEKKKEEERFNTILEEHKKVLEGKELDVRCNMLKARQELLKNVLIERDQQVEERKKTAEDNKQFKEAEAQLSRLNAEANEQLFTQNLRARHNANLQYQEDLRRQIEENNLKKKEEQRKEEERLRQVMEEDKLYRNILEDYKMGKLKATEVKHPFRRVLDAHNK